MDFISARLYFYLTKPPGIDSARFKCPILHVKLIFQRVWLMEYKNIFPPVAAWRLGTVRPTRTPTTPIALNHFAVTPVIT
jgi:hypothetical protein